MRATDSVSGDEPYTGGIDRRRETNISKLKSSRPSLFDLHPDPDTRSLAETPLVQSLWNCVRGTTSMRKLTKRPETEFFLTGSDPRAAARETIVAILGLSNLTED